MMDDHDMNAERNIWPWCDDPSIESNYDDHDDFYGEDDDEPWADDYDDSMDGDHESGLASAGWGLDESYGGYQSDIDAFHDYYGEDF